MQQKKKIKLVSGSVGDVIELSTACLILELGDEATLRYFLVDIIPMRSQLIISFLNE